MRKSKVETEIGINRKGKELKLTNLHKGESAIVLSNESQGQIRRRLLDMGIVKGTMLSIVRKAPLGDPIELEMNGFYLSLRLDEAEKIMVKII